LSFPISGTDLKDKKVVPKWYMGPKGDNKRVYPHFPPSEPVYNLITAVVDGSLSIILVVVYILFSCIHKVLLIMPPRHLIDLLQLYSLHNSFPSCSSPPTSK
jgi:hypothetical protein